jgi:pyruvate dehydrogenase E2 component (dihydrolipoamide acetyltransferase)
MPKFGFTQEEAQLVRWIKHAGESVEQGEPIAEVTTDKINMEVEAPASGVLADVSVREGDTIPVTSLIAYIFAPGEPLPAPGPAQAQAPLEATQPRITPIAARLAAEQGVDVERIPGSGPRGRVMRRDVETYLAGNGDKVRATPAARRAARESGLNLAKVAGSGPQGRIQASDVLAAQATVATQPAAPSTAPSAPRRAPTIIPLAGIRKTIATRMQQSARDAPHITLAMDLETSAAEALRARANQGLTEGQPRISLTAILTRTAAWALRRHPWLNSRLEGENILLLPNINIGIAVALDDGLIVPVVREADQKGVVQLAAEIADLSERARSGALSPDDVAEGTFTISNLGMFGVDRFTAILNPPQAAILAVGRVSKRVIPNEADQPVVRPMLTVTLSADHRIVDGVVAARFLADLREGFERPETLIL